MVNISLRDKETWHDQKPSHRPTPKAVLVAKEHAHNCTREYNERLNAELNKGEAGGVIGWTDVTILANRANDAERELLAARELALNTCKHENTSMTGSMWFSGGEVDDDFETVCEDCGARLEGGE